MQIVVRVHKPPRGEEIATTSQMIWDVCMLTCYPTRGSHGAHVTHQAWSNYSIQLE